MAPVTRDSWSLLSRSGTGLKTSFTMPEAARYAFDMLLLCAAARASANAPPPWSHKPAVAMVQARATVRIISGATLQLGRRNEIEGQHLRNPRLDTPCEVQPAQL